MSRRSGGSMRSICLRSELMAPEFFESTSCSIALSKDKSATGRFSLLFSSSSYLSRRSSDGPKPPNFLCQL